MQLARRPAQRIAGRDGAQAYGSGRTRTLADKAGRETWYASWWSDSLRGSSAALGRGRAPAHRTG